MNSFFQFVRGLGANGTIFGVMAAMVAAIIALVRRDARQDIKKNTQQKDVENAKDISDRVRADRDDPDRMQHIGDAGYRD